jgi:hypothetical protein
MTCSYYIYYRVDPAQAEACAAKVRDLLAEIHAKTGIRGRLLTKRGEPNLWMEIYEGVADEARFEWELADAVNRLGIQTFLQPHTTRHTECFLN